MISVAFGLPYPPVTGNTMARHTKTGGHYSNPKFVAWRNEVRAVLGRHGFIPEEPHSQRCHIDVRARPPDAKSRDADNLMKVIGDALVYSGMIADDSNKVLRSVRVEWSDPEPGAPGALSIVFTGVAGG